MQVDNIYLERSDDNISFVDIWCRTCWSSGETRCVCVYVCHSSSGNYGICLNLTGSLNKIIGFSSAEIIFLSISISRVYESNEVDFLHHHLPLLFSLRKKNRINPAWNEGDQASSSSSSSDVFKAYMKVDHEFWIISFSWENKIVSLLRYQIYEQKNEVTNSSNPHFFLFAILLPAYSLNGRREKEKDWIWPFHWEQMRCQERATRNTDDENDFVSRFLIRSACRWMRVS